jgi:GST-like protein
MWQMAELGPMQGQAHVFVNYFPEKIEAVIHRYQQETKRLYQVLDSQLADKDYICDDYSIVDIACWPLIRSHARVGIELTDFANLARWFKQIEQRPAVIRGIEKHRL